MPRLLAVDLDGTLCRRDGTIDPRDRAALSRIRQAGVAVALVTGRLAAGTLPVAEDLGLVGTHAVADGAVLVDHPGGAVRARASLPPVERALLRSLIREVPGPTYLLTEAAVLHDPRGANFLRYMATWSPDLRPVRDTLADPLWEDPGPVNAVTIGPRAVLDEVLAVLEAETALTTLTFDSSAHPEMGVIVVRPPGKDKGTGITRLAAEHGWGPGEVVAVGDWLNDVPMFQRAGRSFAVPGCPAVLSEVATDHLSAAGGQGAVAEAIQRTWGV